MDDLCTMCEQAPATTTWGFPVCQPCADSLTELQADLKAMEAEDSVLAEQGRRVEAAAARFLAEREAAESGSQGSAKLASDSAPSGSTLTSQSPTGSSDVGSTDE